MGQTRSPEAGMAESCDRPAFVPVLRTSIHHPYQLRPGPHGPDYFLSPFICRLLSFFALLAGRVSRPGVADEIPS
jgi:hypothetical protein